MTPKQAIEKAIEGGWESDIADIALLFLKEGAEEYIRWQSIALDPSFWQALGKALGWNEEKCEFPKSLADFVWQNTAYVFYDLILTGGDTEAFWNELLK